MLTLIQVALRKESVDRNAGVLAHHARKIVALRKESVDRNIILAEQLDRTPPVALRKESVDRNTDGTVSGSGDYGRSPQGERG